MITFLVISNVIASFSLNSHLNNFWFVLHGRETGKWKHLSYVVSKNLINSGVGLPAPKMTNSAGKDSLDFYHVDNSNTGGAKYCIRNAMVQNRLTLSSGLGAKPKRKNCPYPGIC